MPRIPKPVLYLPFNGNAKDYSGYDNHGTVYNATLTTGMYDKPNSAYSFDGTNNYIIVLNSTSLDLTNKITIGAWIYWNGSGDTHQGIISKGCLSYPGIRSWDWYILGDYLYWVSGDTIGSGGPKISKNSWTYVNVTADNDLSQVYLYKNGVAYGPYTDTLDNYDRSITIGALRRLETGISFFNGFISDVRIYNVALTPTQIKYLYNLTKRNYR